MPLLIAGVVIVVLIVFVLLWVMGIYNGLVRARLQSESSWAQIDVQLKRRYDLIPNLVETVKGYAAHEKTTLEAVIKARQQAVSATTVKDQVAADNVLTGTLRQLFALSESYPDLKANQNFIALQTELASTENQVGGARQVYNNATNQYNTARQMFPASIIANFLGFAPRDFFEVKVAEEREAPKVKF